MQENNFIKQHNGYLNLYCYVYITIILIGLGFCIITRINPFYLILKYTAKFNNDFVVSCKYAINGYSANLGHPYPPLATLLYTILGKCLSPIDNTNFSTLLMRLLAVLRNFLILFFYSILLYKTYDKNKIRVSLIVILMIICRSCYLSTLHDTNLSFPSAILSLFFALNYDNKSKINYEISLIALSVAAALRITPAVYSFALLLNKDRKGFIKFLLYTLLLFVLSAFFILPEIKYFDRLLLFIQSLLQYVDSYTYSKIGCYKAIFEFLLGIKSYLGFTFDIRIVLSILSKITFILLILSSILFSKKNQIFMCLTSAQLMTGGMTDHILSLFIIPLVLFTLEEDKLEINKIFKFILLAIMQLHGLIAIQWLTRTEYLLSINSFIDDLLLDIQIFIILFEAYVLFIKNKLKISCFFKELINFS